jgi:hypothetical protein
VGVAELLGGGGEIEMDGLAVVSPSKIPDCSHLSSHEPSIRVCKDLEMVVAESSGGDNRREYAGHRVGRFRLDCAGQMCASESSLYRPPSERATSGYPAYEVGSEAKHSI